MSIILIRKATKWLESIRRFNNHVATGKLRGYKGFYCCEECGSSFEPGQLEKLLADFAKELLKKKTKK